MKDYRELFTIEEGFLALNHGSFGACPKEVMRHYYSLCERLESLTTRFYCLEMKPQITESLTRLARFVNTSADNLVFVRNATTAANSVMNSIPWQKGDEIVTTDPIYLACRNMLNYYSETKGVVIRSTTLPFPVENDDQVVSEVMKLVNKRTKLAFIDHIASETAVIMPVEKLINELRKEKVPVFIDGAHAPGMLPLDLENLSPDYYTGNCHKWLCAPKGSAFLYVKPEMQESIVPSVISLFFRRGDSPGERFFNSFFWTGTANDSLSCCCVKKAIDYLDEAVEGGWQGIRERNGILVRKGRDIIKEILKYDEHTPDSMTGSIVSFRMNSQTDKDKITGMDRLALRLLQEYKMEVFIAPLYPTNERVFRISAHIYNKESDYVKLAESLKKILSV